MTVRRALFSVVTFLLLGTLVFAESRPTVAPLPNDPLELATGPTKVLDTPQLRATVLGLVEQARQNNGMHMLGGASFDLKATIDNKGKVEEAETPPTSDVSLSEAALSLVTRTEYAPLRDGPPRQRLAYIEVRFTSGK